MPQARHATRPKSDDGRPQRLQVPITDESLRRIDELAELVGRSRADIAGVLLEEGLNDADWVIRHITAPILKMQDRIRRLYKRPEGGNS